MKVYKSCACRNPETGKQYGKGKCPMLSKRHHGKYYGRYEAPRAEDGTRRQPRLGPFDTEAEAKDAISKALGRLASTGHVDDRQLRIGPYLDSWHEARVSQAENGEGLKVSTLAAEEEIIALYLRPGLGHLKVADLRADYVRDLAACMRRINRETETKRQSDTLRRLLAARADRSGRRYSTRPLSESRIKRVVAVLSAALNTAVRIDHILLVNPVTGIFNTKGQRRRNRVKPLLWTAERVAAWERTGHVPGRVMVWSPTQTGSFLDFVEASQERLYGMFRLTAYYGPRRGELIGGEWPDMSIDDRAWHVRQAQTQEDDELDDPKSEAGDRVVIFDEGTGDDLRQWKKRQSEERLAWGEAYLLSGRIFTYEDGRPLRPAYVSQRFEVLLNRYQTIRRRHYGDGWSPERIARRHRTTLASVRVALEGPPLPPITFHGLRHGAATMAHASGVSMKAVSEILGHASESFTSDTYTSVTEEMAKDAATKIAGFVPRRRRAGKDDDAGPAPASGY